MNLPRYVCEKIKLYMLSIIYVCVYMHIYLEEYIFLYMCVFIQSTVSPSRYLMTHHDPSSPALARNLYRLAQERGVTSSLLQSVASHGDDIVLIFRFNRNTENKTSRDLQMAALLTELWTNFVKTGLDLCCVKTYFLFYQIDRCNSK